MKNRLAQETSPYLLQHQDNPVDWYAWGPEAVEKAKSEDKPILLSVGYSACHWCHVMAHESFEDKATAQLMNELFINIKVDREERPDIDSIYMNAVQAMTGSGGWPMTVVMTPDGKPFFGGTYFPPDDRYGRPSFRRVLLSLADAWKNRRAEVEESATTMKQYLQKLSSISDLVDLDRGELSADILPEALGNLSQSFDSKHGGFGSAPKFPPHSALRWLLRQNDETSRSMVYSTLDHMALGGIYDQIGGGFARYSVDAIWLVPHFEKMLYDNAQLTQRYTEAYAQTKNPLYKKTIEETLEFILRELTSLEGGFYSALDADSEGEEGKFYVWDEEEFDDLLGHDSSLAKRYFGVSSAGNFEHKNILERSFSAMAICEQFGLSAQDLKQKILGIKVTLLEARERRIRPGLDDKILTSWNGLMMAAFADAGRVLKRQDYIDVAVKNAQFLRGNVYKDGRLFHSYKKGQAKIQGLLEDYAYLGLALLSLYRATYDSQWMLWALELAQTVTTHFVDERGGFFSTADDAEALIIRPKNYFDSPMPSENAATAEFLLILSRYTSNSEWENLAVHTLKTMTEAMRKQPNGFASLLCVLQTVLTPSKEIAIFASKEEAKVFLDEIETRGLSEAAIVLVEDDDNPLIAQFPFLQNRGRIKNQATVYVCEAGVCKLPVTTLETFKEQL